MRIDCAETVRVFTGKVELGQGIVAALARIAADELDVSPHRVQVFTADTEHGLDEVFTAGSLSVVESGMALRHACAAVRRHLLELAAERHGRAPEHLVVRDGIVFDDAGPVTTFWELAGGRPLALDVTGNVPPKRAQLRRITGRRDAARTDLVALVTGGTRFVQDMRCAGMLHGRVVRPPGPCARLAAIDDDDVQSLPGVKAVVRTGSFIGVVAEGEHQSRHAADVLRRRADWRWEGSLPSQLMPAEWLLSQPARTTRHEGSEYEAPAVDGCDGEGRTLKATYTREYLMHAAIGPSAAMARFDGPQLTVWSHSQGIFPLRRALAASLHLDLDRVRVIHVVGPGCYGHNGADDAALDASLLARAVPGRPVLLKWERSDEHQWEPYGPPGVVELEASLDAEGNILDWRHDVWSTSHSTRPGRSPNLLAGAHIDPPIEAARPAPDARPEFGEHRNAVPIYRVPRRRIASHFVEVMPIRTSALRALGAYLNVFAIESFMGELAAASGFDPLEFRLRHLEEPRAREVLEETRRQLVAPSPGDGQGRGLGFARYKNGAGYAAVVLDAEVDDVTAEINVVDALVVADVGEVIDPSGLENQLEGGVVQSLSWTLKERVTFDARTVTSADWSTYPILRFDEVPPIRTVILDRPDQPPLGAGEIVQGPTAAALANAVRDATGIALRNPPFTPSRVRDAALDAGV